MTNDIKKRITALQLEKKDNLLELGKILKSSNVLEIKELNSYLPLKASGKQLAALKIKLEKCEENENVLKNINKKMKELKTQKSLQTRFYSEKLREVSKTIIAKYPENIDLVKKYKINMKAFKEGKRKNDISESIDLNKKTSFLKKIMKKIKAIHNAITSNINKYRIQKQFNNKVLKKYLDDPDLEKIVEEFTGNTLLSSNLVSKFMEINNIESEIKKSRNEAKNLMSNNNEISNKQKIEKEIINETKLNNNIVEKIAEEFMEKVKVEKIVQKNQQVNKLINKIEEISLNIRKLENELNVIIKKNEIENLKTEMKRFRKEKEISEKMLNELNAKIESIQKELSDLDN